MALENFVERFENVLLQCPVDGSPEQMTVGEFSKLEMGQKFLGAMATSHAALLEAGMDDEKALTIIGGAALVRDENENIMGLQDQIVEVDSGETKKKLMNIFQA